MTLAEELYPGTQKVEKNNSRAALWLLASAALFTLMSVSVKYLGEEMHPFQISFFRLLVSLIVIWPFLMRMGGFRAGISTSVPGLQLLRGIVGSTAMVLGFYAIVHLPLADAQAFSFSRNLFIVPLAFVLLSEAAGLRRTLATLVGFAGVVIMLRPGGDMVLGLPVGAALGHAVLVAVATILVNIASRYDRPVTLMFYTGVVGLMITAIPAIWVWKPVDINDLILLFVMGTLGAMAHNCFIRAYAQGEASVIAPVDYTRLIMAAIAGYLLFSNVPDAYTVVGAAIIISSSFYLIRREAQLRVSQN